MRYYKLAEYPYPAGKPLGYCTATIEASYYGLYYISVVGFKHPLWYVDAEGLTPYPFDSIVGFKIGNIKHIYTNQEVEKYLLSLGVTIGDTGFPLGEYNQKTVDMIRSWRPGWQWNPQITEGTPGESIINEVVKPILVDGQELIKVLRQVKEYNLIDPAEAIKQLLSNGAPYKITEQEMIAATMD